MFLPDFNNELNITSKEKLLVKMLLKRYEKLGKEGRPVVNTSDPVKVLFGLSLIQILDVDIKDQVLKTNIWYTYVSYLYLLHIRRLIILVIGLRSTNGSRYFFL